MRRRDISFSDLLNRIYDSKKEIPTITFQVTNACNLACSYCYQINKGTKVMSFNTAKKLIDLLLEPNNKNCYFNSDTCLGVVLEFIGGEPLLQAKLIDEIITYFQQRTIQLNHPWKDKFCASLCTNGVLYFSKDTQDLIKHHNNHLDISVTVDGCKEMHDSCRLFPNGNPSYDLAIAADKDRLLTNGEAGTKITLAPSNISYLYKSFINMYTIGHRIIHANCVFEEGWKLSDAIIYYKQLKQIADFLLSLDDPDDIYFALFNESNYKPIPETDNDNWCGGTGKMLACDPDGKLYPCLRYMESSLGTSVKPLVIGDVDNGICYTLDQQTIMNSLRKINRRSQSTEECFYCPIAQGCSWCSGYNYQRFGTPNKRATFICNMHKAESLANVYYWNNYYKKFNLTDKFPLYCDINSAIKIVGKEEYKYLLNLSTLKGGNT